MLQRIRIFGSISFRLGRWIIPSQRSLNETGVKGLEEEHRLAYVGITRAERHCTIIVKERVAIGAQRSRDL